MIEFFHYIYIIALFCMRQCVKNAGKMLKLILFDYMKFNVTCIIPVCPFK